MKSNTCIGCCRSLNPGGHEFRPSYYTPLHGIPESCWVCYHWTNPSEERTKYQSNFRTCFGCRNNNIGVGYMSHTAFALNDNRDCLVCYSWDNKNEQRLEYWEGGGD